MLALGGVQSIDSFVVKRVKDFIPRNGNYILPFTFPLFPYSYASLSTFVLFLPPPPTYLLLAFVNVLLLPPHSCTSSHTILTSLTSMHPIRKKNLPLGLGTSYSKNLKQIDYPLPFPLYKLSPPLLPLLVLLVICMYMYAGCSLVLCRKPVTWWRRKERKTVWEGEGPWSGLMRWASYIDLFFPLPVQDHRSDRQVDERGCRSLDVVDLFDDRSCPLFL